MNLILLEEQEVAENKVDLDGRRAEHVVKILRAETGDTVRVGIIGGAIGKGIITGIKKKFPFSVSLELFFSAEFRAAEPVVDLVLAVPRPIMLRRILSQAAALGVGKIFLINARRVEKSFWDATILEPENMKEQLLAGLEQAIDTRIPEIVVYKRFKPFVEDMLPTIVQDYKNRIIAHPGGNKSLRQIIQPGGRVLLAVGPEGGWIDYEVEKFCDQGFLSCTMGRRILKVDTAVIALHAGISALLD